MSLLTLFLAVVLAGLGQGVLLRRAARRMTYRRSFSRAAAFCGEQAEMVEVLANPSRLPLPWVRVQSRMPAGLGFSPMSMREINGGLYHRSFFFLAPRTRLTRRHQVRCLRRGDYRLTTVALTAGELLGLSALDETLDCDAHLLVYPRLMDLEEIPLPCQSFLGDVLVRRFINPDPCLVNGARPYQPGDPPRMLHYAASLRTGQWQVKTCDASADPKMLVLLNVARSARQWADLGEQETQVIEDALSLAATVCLLAIDRGAAAGLAANTTLTDEEEEALLLPDRSTEQKDALLSLCARMTLKMHRTFPAFLAQLTLPPGVEDVLILTCYEDEAITAQAERFREQGARVVCHLLEGGESHG